MSTMRPCNVDMISQYILTRQYATHAPVLIIVKKGKPNIRIIPLVKEKQLTSAISSFLCCVLSWCQGFPNIKFSYAISKCIATRSNYKNIVYMATLL